MLFNIIIATLLSTFIIFLLPLFVLKFDQQWSAKKKNIVLIFASLILIVLFNIIIEIYLHYDLLNGMHVFNKSSTNGYLNYLDPKEVFQATVWFLVLVTLMQLVLLQKKKLILPIIGLVGIAIFSRSLLLDYSLLNPQECPPITEILFNSEVCKNRYKPEVYLDLINQKRVIAR